MLTTLQINLVHSALDHYVAAANENTLAAWLLARARLHHATSEIREGDPLLARSLLIHAARCTLAITQLEKEIT